MVKVRGTSKSPLPPKPTADSFDGIAVGDIIAVHHEPGRFRVTQIVMSDDGEECRWVTAFGGEGYPAKSESIYVGTRSFTLDKIVRSSAAPTASGEAAAPVVHGRRDPSLLADMQSELARTGSSSRPAPSDPKEEKSLRERYYTAARKLGMKVKVRLVDGMIVAKVKEEAA